MVNFIAAELPSNEVAILNFLMFAVNLIIAELRVYYTTDLISKIHFTYIFL